MKKLTSLLLALMLSAALTIPAFADGFTPSSSQEGTDPVVPGKSDNADNAPTSPQTGEADPVWVITGIAGLAAGTCIVVKKRSEAR